MRISRAIAALPGVEEAGLMIGTPANKEILREAGLLGDIGEQAGPGDLVIALRAKDAAAADAAMAEARRLLDQPRRAAARRRRLAAAHAARGRAADARRQPGADLGARRFRRRRGAGRRCGAASTS